ncbi:hypothetical protein MHK_001762, partial [Candidatus Magnetomorum sp. HK-1]
GLIEDEFHLKTGKITSWKEWLNLFNKQRGIFDTPVILLIDEFDKLHTQLIYYHKMWLDLLISICYNSIKFDTCS